MDPDPAKWYGFDRIRIRRNTATMSTFLIVCYIIKIWSYMHRCFLIQFITIHKQKISLKGMEKSLNSKYLAWTYKKKKSYYMNFKLIV